MIYFCLKVVNAIPSQKLTSFVNIVLDMHFIIGDAIKYYVFSNLLLLLITLVDTKSFLSFAYHSLAIART